MARSVTPQRTTESKIRPNGESIVLAALAAVVILAFRSEFNRSLPVMWLEVVIYFSIPLILMGWIITKYSPSPDVTTNRGWTARLQSVAFVFALLPIFAQFILRPLEIGDAYEIVALSVMMNACWFLAVFSRFGKFARASFVIGCVLVLFVCFMTQKMSVCIPAAIYAVLALWWLLGNYWNRVSVKAIDVESNSLPIRGFALIGTAIVVAFFGIIAATVGPTSEIVAIKGFMPSSGGDSWYDAYARSGIGDGEMLTAGKNATTSGAVDSEDFIEDDKPSMYDIMTDKFEGPLKIKKRRNRAVALDNATAKHMHNVIQSEQKGKSFRTVRQPKYANKQDLENRITDALMFVEGQVPFRLTMDCYHEFDGWDWEELNVSKVSPGLPPIVLEKQLGKPWFVIKSVLRDYLPSYRAHRVKIMRLEDEIVPAPPLFKSWHIYQVDRRDLFRWSEEGLVRMDGEFIPTHTMIDVVSLEPNYHTLRAENKSTGKSHIETDPESPFVQVPDNDTKAKLEELTASLTQGIPEGWRQVEAIVEHFRTNYEHDPTAVAPPDCDDVVGWFLENGRGPTYLFATAATQSLRVAGYRTRLASGFVATKEDYDRLSNQSIITSDNLHMWPEVSMDGWHWLPVEPSPGYPMPFNTSTLAQRIYASIYWFFGLFVKYPLTAFALLGLASAMVYFRRSILATLGWIGWQVSLILMPDHRLRLTRKLLDLRFWAADLPRPEFIPPAKWYTQVDSSVGGRFIDLWHSRNFSSNFDTRSSAKEIYAACREVVQDLTLNRIRVFANQSQPKDNK